MVKLTYNACLLCSQTFQGPLCIKCQLSSVRREHTGQKRPSFHQPRTEQESANTSCRGPRVTTGPVCSSRENYCPLPLNSRAAADRKYSCATTKPYFGTRTSKFHILLMKQYSSLFICRSPICLDHLIKNVNAILCLQAI